MASLGVLDHVGERLLGRPVDLLFDLWRQGHALLEGLHVDDQVGPGRGGLGVLADGRGQSFLAERLGSELEDQRAHLRQGVLGQLPQPRQAAAHVVHQIGLFLLEGELGRTGLQGHREQGLGDRVVQLSGQPMPGLDGQSLLGLGEQPGVLDRHPGLRGQGHDRTLVLGGERGRVVLLGEIQVAVDPPPDTDRDPKERGHRGMVGRKAHRPRVVLDPLQTKRVRLGDQHPQDPLPHRQVPDRPAFGLGDAVGDEVVQPPVRSQDPQGPVLGIGDLAGQLDDLLQRGR